tara:strand:- start:3470 stop:4240 length:771 start_codon:yes stop_codon:yes gene_type:complete
MSVIVGYNTNPNGLSLYLDAGNPNSYPGSGTTWYDLSTNSANVSTGSMTYVNAGLSSFSSSYVTASLNTSSIDFYAPNLSTVATVEMVCRFNNYNWGAGGGQATIFGWSGLYWAGLSTNGGLFFNDDSCVVGNYAPFLLPNSGSSRNGSAAIFGIWYYLVFEMYNGSIGPNTILDNKIWVNGVQQNLALGAGTPGTKNFGGGNGAIATRSGYVPPTNVLNINGINDYAMFKVYNRTLSQSEITNNYNYYKPFYNLY